jgi:hypothetical protein
MVHVEHVPQKLGPISNVLLPGLPFSSHQLPFDRENVPQTTFDEQHTHIFSSAGY